MSGPPGSGSQQPYSHSQSSPPAIKLDRSSQGEAGPSRFPNHQYPSGISSRNIASTSSQYISSSQSRIARSHAHRPSDAIDLTQNHKGKGKAAEPIDLTLIDTDEEGEIEEMGRAKLQSSSGSIVLMDKDGRPVGGKSKGKDPPTKTFLEPPSSSFIPGRPRRDGRADPGQTHPAGIRNPASAMLARRNFDAQGLSRHQAIDLCSNSSRSASPEVLQLINDGNGRLPPRDDPVKPTLTQANNLHQRNFTKSASSQSINLGRTDLARSPSTSRTAVNSKKAASGSPRRVKRMPKQPTVHRMSKDEWDAAVDERKKTMEAEKMQRDSRTPSLQSTSPQTSRRSASKESSTLGTQVHKVMNESPLRKPIPLFKTENSPSRRSPIQTSLSQGPTQALSLSQNQIRSKSKTPTKSLTQPHIVTPHPRDSCAPRLNAEAGPSKPTQSSVKSKHFSPHQPGKDERPHRPQPELQPRKPSRERPQPGAYTLPPVETSIHDWPRTQSTYSAGGSKKRNSLNQSRDKEKGKQNQSVSPQKRIRQDQLSTTSSVQKSTPDNSSTQLSMKSHDTLELKQDNIIFRNSSSTSSSLTPLSSPTSPTSLFHNNEKERYEPSPVKSLSASPVKGKPFPRLFGDETPLSKIYIPKKDESVLGEEDENDSKDPSGNAEDIFAEFADFDWAASDDEAPKEGSDLVQDPSDLPKDIESVDQNQHPNDNTSSSRIEPVLATSPHKRPSSSQTMVAMQLEPGRTSPTTPRSSQKRSRPSTSPTQSCKRRNISEKYTKFLEEERIRVETEKEAEREKEKQMESEAQDLLETKQHEGNDEDGGGDLDGFLDNIAPTSPVKPNMRTAIQSRQESRKAKIEEAKATRRKAKLQAIQQSAKAERLGTKKLEDQKFRSVLKVINKNKDINDFIEEYQQRRQGEEAYPTPETEWDDDDDDSPLSYSSDLDDLEDIKMELDRSFDIDVDLDALEGEDGFNDVVEELRKEGVGLDDSLIRDARASMTSSKVRKDQGLTWEGFWEREPIRPEEKDQKRIVPFDIDTHDPMLKMICEMARQPDADLESLGHILSSGVMIFVEKDRRELANALFNNAISSSDPTWSAIARSCFSDMLQMDEYLRREDLKYLLGLGIKLLLHLGARRSTFSNLNEDLGHIEDESGIMIGREEACGMICRILMAEASRSNDAIYYQTDPSGSIKPQNVGWIPILLLMSIDNSTSSALKRTIGETIQVLLHESVLEAENMIQLVYSITRAIVDASTQYPNAVKVAILDSLGQKSNETTVLYRWLAMEWLLPGTMAKVETMDKRSLVPPIPFLLLSIDNISDLIRPPSNTTSDEKIEPDWSEINFLVTFLYGSMSDIETLLRELNVEFNNEQTSGIYGERSIKDLMQDCEIERVREGLRRCRDLISDQSNGTLKSTVKARLHQLYEITRLTLMLSITKKVRAKRLGKGLKVGNVRGQAQLDFTVRPVDKKEPKKTPSVE
ncbi:hypothetical protein L486_07868 [Kwoniella mangroviensis CBS 10435]|uniref:Uncharacterized protein n=1 Tax=Kwoniella mangroviensis CBS 10435 TaxID=1331196 RepID=A0A1B9IH82_9TREE|nr:hypothetical protein L486_07868 [Kwoniella mangroviensis CBS 10435]